tara:strand:- start:5494 stop:5889 length:396 start_codon:yes stop_codon:yes gene_type:complete
VFKKFKQYLQFNIVGSSGLVINLVIFSVFNSILNFSINTSAVTAFFFSNCNNYYFNNRWTFKSEFVENKFKFSQFFTYLSSCLVGLAVNIITLNVFVILADVKYVLIGQFLGILSGSLFNFFLAKYFVFKT